MSPNPGPTRLAVLESWVPVVPTFFGAFCLAWGIALGRVAFELGMALGTLSLFFFLLRKERRVRPHRGDCRVLWTVARLPVREIGRVPLARITAVAFEERVVSTSKGRRTEYPVSLLGFTRLKVWAVGSPLAARRLGERIARAAWKPLWDQLGPTSARGPEELEMCLGRRLRHRGWVPKPAVAPAGAGYRVRAGPETVIDFPPVEGGHWPLLIPWGVVVVSLAIARRLPPSVGVILVLFAIVATYFTVRMTIDWIEWHRPRQLVLGRDVVERRTVAPSTS